MERLSILNYKLDRLNLAGLDESQRFSARLISTSMPWWYLYLYFAISKHFIDDRRMLAADAKIAQTSPE